MSTYPTPKKLLITGGHITPALATIDEWQRRHPADRFVFIGRKHALEGSDEISEEYRLIHDRHIPFYPLSAGRLKREGGVRAALSLLKVPVGFVQAFRYVRKEKPDCIVSFGGYIALPVVTAGYMLGVPVVTHEQTRKPGLANRIIARMARITCVSYPDGSDGIAGHLKYTGLPFRKGVFHPPVDPSFSIPRDDTRLMLIVGGSTGSVSVNTIVFEALPSLLQRFTIVHQVGRLSYAQAIAIRSGLGKLRDRYVPVPYLSESDYSWAIHHALFVLGRSGANTVLELASVGVPAIFIPLPWAANNEQYYNARFMEKTGSAKILPQQSLTPQLLVDTVSHVFGHIATYGKAAKKLSTNIPRDGAVKFADAIESALE